MTWGRAARLGYRHRTRVRLGAVALGAAVVGWGMFVEVVLYGTFGLRLARSGGSAWLWALLDFALGAVGPLLCGLTMVRHRRQGASVSRTAAGGVVAGLPAVPLAMVAVSYLVVTRFL